MRPAKARVFVGHHALYLFRREWPGLLVVEIWEDLYARLGLAKTHAKSRGFCLKKAGAR